MINFSYEFMNFSYEMIRVSYELVNFSYEMISLSYENWTVSHEKPSCLNEERGLTIIAREIYVVFVQSHVILNMGARSLEQGHTIYGLVTAPPDQKRAF